MNPSTPGETHSGSAAGKARAWGARLLAGPPPAGSAPAVRSGWLRGASVAVAVGFLAAFLGFLYLKARTVDISQHNSVLSQLRQLRALDAAWNDELLKYRLGIPVAGDRQQDVPAAHRRLLGLLDLDARALGSQAVNRELNELIGAVEDKARLMSEFRARAATVHASMAESGLLLRIANSTAGQRLETLERLVGREFEAAAQIQRVYEVYLTAYAGALVVLLGYAAWRLRRSYRVINAMNRELQQAKSGLERRVAERTRELMKTMHSLRESETLLAQTEKMSSLGQMVSGIAHEINTPLAYVKNSLDLVTARLPQIAQLVAQAEVLLDMLQSHQVSEDELNLQFEKVSSLSRELRTHKALDDLKSMLRDGAFGIGQITEIVSNLRNFSRLDRSKVARFDLHEGLQSTLQIARHALEGKTVKKAFGPIPPINCAPSQINQVFMNLIVNAAQATPEEGGVIFIRTALKDPGNVLVEVADNGQGIPEDVLPKIFDPFFTTKDVGKGTGLGLSIVYKIVQQHGGSINVASKVGVGTRFTVVLPVDADSGAAAARAAAV